MKNKFLVIMAAVFLLAACVDVAKQLPEPAPTATPVIIVQPGSTGPAGTPGATGQPGPTGEPGQPGTVQTPPNPLGDSVKLAKYIRLPGSIVSRGQAGAFRDPDEALCTETETVYIFYDDMSIVQYKPLEGYYSLLADAARLTCEIRNRDFPDAAWDYIAVNPPPPPPPITSNDPTLPAGTVAFCDNDGVIHWQYVAEDAADYDRVVGILSQVLELHNRDNDPDCHIVLGGRP